MDVSRNVVDDCVNGRENFLFSKHVGVDDVNGYCGVEESSGTRVSGWIM